MREPRDGTGGESIRETDRFATLFADLESQAAGSQAWVDDIDAEERERAEYAGIVWSDRVRAVRHAEVHFDAVRGESWVLSGMIERVGVDAIFMHARMGREGPLHHWAVSLNAVHNIENLGGGVQKPGIVDARLGLASALREWSTNRVPLTIIQFHRTVEGSAIRVSRDHVEVAEHDVRTTPSPAQVRRVSTIPMSRIHAIRQA